MTTAELLADLRGRIDLGVTALEEAEQTAGDRESIRLLGKASGLLLVRSWLNSYPNEEAPR